MRLESSEMAMIRMGIVVAVSSKESYVGIRD